jgi:VID27 N-terminal region
VRVLIVDGAHTLIIAYRYNEAMAAIRRVPTMEHHFQLVVTRVYEDGDQELLEDEDESKQHNSSGPNNVLTRHAVRHT